MAKDMKRYFTIDGKWTWGKHINEINTKVSNCQLIVQAWYDHTYQNGKIKIDTTPNAGFQNKKKLDP